MPRILCPAGSRVSGFRLRIQPNQKNLDDTALNGIQLACTNGMYTKQIPGVFGVWKKWVFCGGTLKNASTKFVVGFNFRSQGGQGVKKDDTSGNNVKMQCNDGSELDGGGLDWGTWDSKTYKKCSFGYQFCGVQSRIEKNQGNGDDTGMNQMKFLCCRTTGDFHVFH